MPPPCQSERIDQGNLLVRYRDDEAAGVAKMKSKDKKAKRKESKKGKVAAAAVAPQLGEADLIPPPIDVPVEEGHSGSAKLETSLLDQVKRKVPPGESTGITFNDRYYPLNDWSALLRPGPMLALLKCFSAYFVLEDTITLLELKDHEVAELHKLMAEKSRTQHTIHMDEIDFCKRIVLAHVNLGPLTEDIFKRLDAYAEITTCFEEIEAGTFEILDGDKDAGGVVGDQL